MMEALNSECLIIPEPDKKCCDSNEKEGLSDQLESSKSILYKVACIPESYESEPSLIQACENYPNTSENYLTSHFDKTNDYFIKTPITTNEEVPTEILNKPSLNFNYMKVLTGSWSEFNPEKGIRSTEMFLKGCKW